jgi:hypothetical protein
MGSIAEIVLDCKRAAPLAKFWSVALDWPIRPYDDEEVARLAGLGFTPETDPGVAIDAPDGSMTFFVQEVPEPKTGKNRMHVDIRVRGSAHFDQLLAMGARVLAEYESWFTLADPEGNEFCVKKPLG